MSPVPRPKDFDVVLTENMFGDILSDLAGGLVGSMGLAACAEVGETKDPFVSSAAHRILERSEW